MYGINHLHKIIFLYAYKAERKSPGFIVFFLRGIVLFIQCIHKIAVLLFQLLHRCFFRDVIINMFHVEILRFDFSLKIAIGRISSQYGSRPTALGSERNRVALSVFEHKKSPINKTRFFFIGSYLSGLTLLSLLNYLRQMFALTGFRLAFGQNSLIMTRIQLLLFLLRRFFDVLVKHHDAVLFHHCYYGLFTLRADKFHNGTRLRLTKFSPAIPAYYILFYFPAS